MKVRCTAAGTSKRGAGWPIGATGVLTAAHVITHHSRIILGGDGADDETTYPGTDVRVVPDRFLVVGVDPNRGGGEYSCTVIWINPVADLALLQVVPARQDAWQTALTGLPQTVFAEPALDPLPVTATGFPTATLFDTDHYPTPDQIAGILLPRGGGSVIGRMPVDLTTTPPDNGTEWQGMSGAALHEQPSPTNPTGRLIAVITDATFHTTGTSDRERGRLHATPIPDPASDSDFAAALDEVGFTTPVLEDHHAPNQRALLELLDTAGRPYPLGRIPPERFGDLGPRRARADIDLHGNPYYPFITRPSDQPLRDAITAIFTGHTSRLLLLVGQPMTGKSRTLLETLHQHDDLTDALLLSPLPSADFQHVIATTHRLTTTGKWAVLWLDDIHRYNTLTATHLRDLLTIPRVLIAGTLRSDEDSKLQDTERAFASALADQNLVYRVEHPCWTDNDITSLPQDTPALLVGRLREGESLGEILGAAGELAHRLQNGTQEQQALVHILADWPRTGRTTPLPETDTRTLYLTYLTDNAAKHWKNLITKDQKKRWRDTLDWAFEPVAGAAPLITRTRTGLTTDPIHTHHRTKPDTPVPDHLWQHALTTLTTTPGDFEALSVGIAAYHSQQLEIVRAASQYATTSHIPQVAAAAWTLLGIVLKALECSELAVDAFSEVVTRFRDDPAPALRKQVATALYNKGVALVELGQLVPALDAFSEVVTRFRDDPAPALRKQVAMALVAKGVALGKLGRSGNAVAAFGEVMTRFRDDPALQKLVAKARVCKAATLRMGMGRPPSARWCVQG